MIEIIDVSKSYNDKHAVQSVSVSLSKGERWGLLGHNGSGKTTLLKLMMGLVPPTTGKILINGKPTSHQTRKQIGYISQGESLDLGLNVFENLFFFGLYHGLGFKEAKARAKELLASVEIQARQEQCVIELSGGTRKKILILRSLMLDPDLLLLDEPTNQLDVHSRHWLNDLCSNMVKKSKTVLLTSHEITEVENTCDNLMIMSGGKLIDSGSIKELMQKHLKGSVIEYALDQSNITEHDRTLMKRFSGEHIGGSCSLFLDAETKAEKVLETISSPFISLRKPNIKDLYLKLTHKDIEC
jgi:lipooligosaccharide transport system ATP-binding protein